MSDINTTSINDLPTDPVGGGNINLMVNENSPSPDFQNSSVSLDQNTISQIVNGLQQASLTGATSLPSRDIPMNTTQLTQDVYVQPNYIPPPEVEKRDYINESDDDINAYYKNEKTNNSLDALYDELQTPILLAVLYFIFQLPIMKKSSFKYLPFLCNLDGNYNLNGLFFTCILFGFIYYIVSKSVKQFSKF